VTGEDRCLVVVLLEQEKTIWSRIESTTPNEKTDVLYHE
jgi:hypothetical protein